MQRINNDNFLASVLYAIHQLSVTGVPNFTGFKVSRANASDVSCRNKLHPVHAMNCDLFTFSLKHAIIRVQVVIIRSISHFS
jgi:hypothetical protein